MPLTPQGFWIPDLFGKQFDVFNSNARALLVSGARMAGKSVATLHRIVRHLWETPDARVAVFSRIMKTSKDAGPWKNLQENTMPQWIKSGIGMRYTTQNRYSKEWGIITDGQTRTSYFRVTNRHGGESTCLLFSLDDDAEAEMRLREVEFSMIYFSELSKFTSRAVLSLGLLCLRRPGLRFDQQQWIADTNPAEDMEASWIYEVWYVERCQTYAEYVESKTKLGIQPMPESKFTEFKAKLGLIEMYAEDNPRISPEQLSELKQAYDYDSEWHLRFVKGMWTSGSGGDTSRVLRRYFRPNVHLVGNCEDPEESEWEVALPTLNCVELVTGWDPGETNHAVVILERTMMDQYIPSKKITVKRSYFTLLEECVTLDEDISLEGFTQMVMEKLEVLEKVLGRELKLERNWADPSVFNRYNATTQTYPYLVIQNESGGRIELQPSTSDRHYVGIRLQLLRQLLAQERLKISAHCDHTIRMMKNLKKGKNRGETINRSDTNKHVFDALTYALLEECKDELELSSSSRVGPRPTGGLIVSVR